MHKYMKIGKINGKRKKKRDFLLAGPGGFLAQPSARARAGGPDGPPARDGAGRRRGRGPTRQRGGEMTGGGGGGPGFG
jgi:hypothetical protein